jgi:hypothetical protein
MKRNLQTIYTPMFAEAAVAHSVTCWRLPVNDGSRLGFPVSLAERCVR